MNILKLVTDTWSGYRDRQARITELHALESGDLRILMQDTGLTFCELLRLAKREGETSGLLGRRLKTIGLDASKIDGAVLRDLQRCCSECQHKDLCEHELDDKPKAATWPAYCPNQLTLEALTKAIPK